MQHRSKTPVVPEKTKVVAENTQASKAHRDSTSVIMEEIRAVN